MPRYLVCRKDGINEIGEQRSQLNSSYFPIMVEAPEYISTEAIVKQAFKQQGWDNYKAIGKSYVVFEIASAMLVNFKRREDYDVFVEPYYG